MDSPSSQRPDARHQYSGELSRVSDRVSWSDAGHEAMDASSEGDSLSPEAGGDVGGWDWDLLTDRVRWSDQLYRLFGLEPQSQEGGLEAFVSLLDPGERDAAERSVREARDTGQIFTFDHQVRGRDGEVRILESRGQVVVDAEGGPVRMVGTVRDVTFARLASHELPLTDRRLRQSSQALRHRERLMAMSDAVAAAANASTSLTGVVTEAVRLVAEATGWPVGHGLVPGREADRLVSRGMWVADGVDRAALIKESRRPFGMGEGLAGRVWATGGPLSTEDPGADEPFLRSAAAAGSGLRAAVAFPVLIGDEVVAVIEFFTVDELNLSADLLQTLQHVGSELGRVAERERAALALAAHERRFRQVLDDATEIVATVDVEGVVRYLSPSVCRILGVDGVDVAGEVRSRVHPDDRRLVRQELAALRNTPGERRRFEFRVRDADDNWRHLEAVATNLLEDPDVASIVLHCSDVTEQRQAETQLEHQRLHDPLTGCPTRTLFAKHLQRALTRESRYRHGVAVFAVDVDQFHVVNEHHGHDVGDAVLVVVAQRLEGALRAYDTVSRPGSVIARLGGDEFFALCEDVGTDLAVIAIGRRLAAAIAEPLVIDEREIAVSATVGAAVSRGGEIDSDLLLVHAETAVQRAKRDPSSHVELFDQQARQAVEVHDEHVAALRDAISLGQLRLHYQPKVEISSGRLVGVEALVRWEHPTRGMVPPGGFIPLAEESGLIGSLGEWVLAESCRQQALWAETLGANAPPMVSVNVSGHQFVPGFVDVVQRTIERTGVVAEMVCVEITESVMMADIDTAVDIVQQLKSLGLVVSIDDFGTGYSSLSHLKRFPIDELKIDKSFVDGLGTDPDDTAIVAAMVAMAHALGLLVIAEGVETIDQLERLRNLGCELAQGYLFSRPLPPEDLAALGSVLNPLTDAPPPAQSRPTEVVLVVDDAADVRQLANVSLATSGFEVLEAVSGEEGLQEARRSRPACIVLDVTMPGMNGFDACRALRSDPLTLSAAIVMLTSRADAGDKVEAFSAGADEYMVKPFAPRELVSRVRQAITRRTAQSNTGTARKQHSK